MTKERTVEKLFECLGKALDASRERRSLLESQASLDRAIESRARKLEIEECVALAEADKLILKLVPTA